MKTARSTTGPQVLILSSTAVEDQRRIGGAAGFVRGLLPYLPEGWSLATPDASNGGSPGPDGRRCIRLGPALGRSLIPARLRFALRVLRARARLLSTGAEVIYCHDEEALFPILFRGAAGRSHVRLVVHQHGAPNPLVRSTFRWARHPLFVRGYHRLRRWAYRRADLIVAIDSDCLDCHREWGTLDRTVLIPNGVDLERFRPIDEPTERLRGEFALPAEPYLFLAAGRLERVKRVERLIEAVECIPADPSSRPVGLVVAGEGTEGERLRRRAADGPAAERIFFVAGVDKDRMPRLYNAVDALALSSELEGVPMVVLEALAVGKPVVCTDVGGLASVVDDSCGRVVPAAGEVTALAGALAAVCRTDWSAGAIRRRAERFSAEAVARELVERFGALCDRGRRA